MGWLTSLWSFTIVMLNLWAVYFGCKIVFNVISFIIAFFSGFTDGFNEQSNKDNGGS